MYQSKFVMHGVVQLWWQLCLDSNNLRYQVFEGTKIVNKHEQKHGFIK